MCSVIILMCMLKCDEDEFPKETQAVQLELNIFLYFPISISEEIFLMTFVHMGDALVNDRLL